MVSEQMDFASGESLLDQCKHIFIAQVQCALDQLGPDPRSAKIHGGRKALKRARATLRLLRPAIGNEAYRHTNVTLRDVARPLSQARDAEVSRNALDKVLRRFGESADGLDVRRVQKNLTRARSRAKQSARLKEHLPSLREALSAVKARAPRWKLSSHESSSVFDAIRRTYSRVRRAEQAALQHRSTEHLHEWRKQTKYLWHQVRMFEPGAPGELGTYADALHRLSDYLGEDHDLAILRSTVFDAQTSLSDRPASVLKVLIDRRRAELQAKAFASAEMLLQERPKQWRRNLKQYQKVQMKQRSRAAGVAAEEQEDLTANVLQRVQDRKRAASTLH